ncbi:hypothetical protein GCM10027442_37580 [Emticicia fontis]
MHFMTLSENSVVRVKDVQELFQCSERTAKIKMRQVREALGKPVNKDGKKGGGAITLKQVKGVFGL